MARSCPIISMRCFLSFSFILYAFVLILTPVRGSYTGSGDGDCSDSSWSAFINAAGAINRVDTACHEHRRRATQRRAEQRMQTQWQQWTNGVSGTASEWVDSAMWIRVSGCSMSSQCAEILNLQLLFQHKHLWIHRRRPLTAKHGGVSI